MADKFTRLNAAEGDIFYATTVGGSKSIESLEDNIDNSLLTYLGEDNTGTSTSSTSETEIGEVVVSANTARARVIIFASVTFNGVQADGSPASSTFRIRTGTNSSAPSNTERELISLTQGNDKEGSTQEGKAGALLIATITSIDETFTNDFNVHITAINSGTGGTKISKCERILVLGI